MNEEVQKKTSTRQRLRSYKGLRTAEQIKHIKTFLLEFVRHYSLPGESRKNRKKVYSWDEELYGVWCEVCKGNYPGGLTYFVCFLLELNSVHENLEFIDIVSGVLQKEGCVKHIASDIHLLSVANEAVKRYMAGTLDASKKLINVQHDVDTVAARFRITYTLIRQQVPMWRHVFIGRLINNVGENRKLFDLGHYSRDSIVEMLRIISNDIRGEVDMFLSLVKFVCDLYDDVTDCTQECFLAVMLKMVYPPPNHAAPSLLPPPKTSYLDALKPLTLMPLVQCALCRRPSSLYVTCSYHHQMCAACLKDLVLLLKLTCVS
jgi:hypothetical protein